MGGGNSKSEVKANPTTSAAATGSGIGMPKEIKNEPLVKPRIEDT